MVGSSLIWKKRKISRNGHSLSSFVTRCTTSCHCLSLPVTLCHSLYHSLSFVVTLYHSLPLVVPVVVTCCHSLSLDVAFVCLFINDHNSGIKSNSFDFRERWQLGFPTLNSNLAVNLKPTHPRLLNGNGQFTFLKTKSSHFSGIVVYPPKFEFLRN